MKFTDRGELDPRNVLGEGQSKKEWNRGEVLSRGKAVASRIKCTRLLTEYEGKGDEKARQTGIIIFQTTPVVRRQNLCRKGSEMCLQRM